MAAANELEMVVSHARRLVVAGAVRSRPTRRSWPTSPGARSAPRARCSSWLFSGMFQRYPNLKIALSEGEIGWMPVLPRAGRAGARQAAPLGDAGPDVHGPRRHRRRPRRRSTSGQTFRDHIFGCFIEDHHGIASLDEIGEDNVMCETDYPHSDSTWPDCIDTAQRPHRGPRARGRSTRSCAATPSGSTGSRRPSRRCSPARDRLIARSVDRDRCIGSGMCIVYAAGTFAQDAEAKVVVLDPTGDDLDADPDRRRGLPDASAARLIDERGRLTHAARRTRTPIITGAGSGVGRASALRFAEEGAKVVVRRPRRRRRQGDRAARSRRPAAPPCRSRVDVSKEDDVVAAIAAAVEQFGRLDILFNNVGIPTPRLGMTLRGAHRRRLRAALRRQRRRRLPTAASTPSSASRSRATAASILNTGSVAGLVGWGGTVYGATKGARAPAHQGRRHRGGARSASGSTPSARRAMPYTGLHGRRRPRAARGRRSSRRRRVGRGQPPARPADHRRGLRRGGRVPRARTGPPTSPASCCRSTAGTSPDDRARAVARRSTGSGSSELFDLRSSILRRSPAATYTDDPHPRVARAARVRSRSTPAPCTSSRASRATLFLHGLPEPGPAALLGVLLRGRATHAYRNPEVFASSPGRRRRPTPTVGFESSMLIDGRHPAPPLPVAGAAVVRAGQGPVVDRQVDRRDRPRADRLVRRRRARPSSTSTSAPPSRCSRSPAASASTSPRRSTSRAALRDPAAVAEILAPIVAARRERPAGRPHQRAGRGRAHRRGRHPPALRRRDPLLRRTCCSPPGSGTTWKQMGITLAALLQRPELLEAVRADRSAAASRAIEESLRWMPTDPMFSRWVTEDTELVRHGHPQGVGRCTSASAPPTATPTRWDRPDEYDLAPPAQALVGLRRRPHICLGMHVARAEMSRRHRRPARPPPEPPARPRRASRRSVDRASTSAASWRSRWCSADCGDHHRTVDYSLLGDEHVRRYRETDGEVGYVWNGAPTLLLTTTGRKQRRAPDRAADLRPRRRRLPLVASVGGSPKHPAWYLNLQADPQARSR